MDLLVAVSEYVIAVVAVKLLVYEQQASPHANEDYCVDFTSV